ncbi:MAG: hypothetical protein IJN42_07815, partial [Clostridia bacterium]|nr:hypothetical protein [Clostridia bacterium]
RKLMYCIKCGVKLAEGEQKCPLCQTTLYHPDLPMPEGEKLYPAHRLPEKNKRSLLPAVLMLAAVLIPLLIVLLCDLQTGGGITWSGYVMGALCLGYVTLGLPLWFARPNPVIFVPCGFLAAAVYLWYIQFVTAGHWFWPFALPALGGVALIVTSVVALLRYVRKGKLYIFGGALIALGGLMYPIEILANVAFRVNRFFGWCFYPMIALCMVGGVLIFVAIYRPARETLQRKFFM